jgi:hypothetical protein
MFNYIQSNIIKLFSCLGDKKTFYLDTSTFLTGVNQIEKGPKRLDNQIPKAAEINFVHTEINDAINVKPYIVYFLF